MFQDGGGGRICFTRDATIIGVIQKVRVIGRGVVIESEQKRTRRGGVLACVYVRFFQKNAEIVKIKFYSYSPVFPINYNGSMKY